MLLKWQLKKKTITYREVRDNGEKIDGSAHASS